MRFFERHPRLKRFLLLVIFAAEEALMLAHTVPGGQLLIIIGEVIAEILKNSCFSSENNDTHNDDQKPHI